MLEAGGILKLSEDREPVLGFCRERRRENRRKTNRAKK
jgi:hypothetical protein